MSEATMEVISPADVSVDDPMRYADGVKYEVAQGIATMLKKGRRYFGSSGAAMTHQAFRTDYIESHEGLSKDTAKEHLEGERDTTKFLKDWMKDKPNVVLVDSVSIPDHDVDDTVDPDIGVVEDGDTDHVLLIGAEIILIDTKRWKKKKNYSVGDEGEALMTNKPFPGGEVIMRESIHEWLDYLDEDACVTGMVCINAEEVSVLRNRNWYSMPYRLIELGRFEELLNEKWKQIDQENKTTINSTLVSQVVVNCIKPFDQYSKVFDMNTLNGFR